MSAGTSFRLIPGSTVGPAGVGVGAGATTWGHCSKDLPSTIRVSPDLIPISVILLEIFDKSSFFGG